MRTTFSQIAFRPLCPRCGRTLPAFYRDRYRRTPDCRRICTTGYDRTHDATMSLENLNFKLKPFAALHI